MTNARMNGAWSRWITTITGLLVVSGIIATIASQISVSRELGEIEGNQTHILSRLDALESGATIPISKVSVAKFQDLEDRIAELRNEVKQSSERIFRLESRR